MGVGFEDDGGWADDEPSFEGCDGDGVGFEVNRDIGFFEASLGLEDWGWGVVPREEPGEGASLQLCAVAVRCVGQKVCLHD